LEHKNGKLEETTQDNGKIIMPSRWEIDFKASVGRKD
jgi:hypothetical protein